MGMFDDVRCELPMPDGREVVKGSFQTKSLGCGMNQYTITANGRLILRKRRYHFALLGEPRPAEHVADIEVDYHGDIEIYGRSADDASAHYVVRFTHGVVEWIQPIEALPESHREWLEQCAP